MLVSLVSHSSQVTSTLSSRTPGSGGYDLGPCWRKDQPLQVQREDRREVRMRFCFEVGHCCVFYVINVSHRCAYLSLMSAIVASASVVDIGHWRGLSVLNVSHRCGCHRPRRWPLLQLQPSPISFSTLAVVVVVVAVVNINSFICNHIVVIDALCTY